MKLVRAIISGEHPEAMQTGSSGCHYNWLTIMLLICLIFCYNQHATGALDAALNTTTSSTATKNANGTSKQKQPSTTYIISTTVAHVITATTTAETTATTIINTDLNRNSLHCHCLNHPHGMGCHHSYQLTSNNVNGRRYCCGCYCFCKVDWGRQTQQRLHFPRSYCSYINDNESKLICLRWCVNTAFPSVTKKAG